jgi:hypothetical protein
MAGEKYPLHKIIVEWLSFPYIQNEVAFGSEKKGQHSLNMD